MKLLLFIPLFILAITVPTACKKIKQSISSQEEKLPDATQEGKNTFGFMLNNSVWIPKSPILKPKLDLSYDSGYQGGSLLIDAWRYAPDGNYEKITIGGNHIGSAGSYEIMQGKVGVYYSSPSCTYLGATNEVTTSGVLIITRFDPVKNVIAGTFSFKLEKVGCPIITAMDGRFDLKIQ